MARLNFEWVVARIQRELTRARTPEEWVLWPPDPDTPTSEASLEGPFMPSRAPALVADGYVSAGASAPLRVRNVFSGITRVQVKSSVFADGLETAYDLPVVDDPVSTTGKSAAGTVPVASDVEPDRYPATVLFPEWNITQENHTVLVDSTTPGDPLYVELVPGEVHENQRMYNLRVSPVSANIAVAYFATDLPGHDLENWYGLVGDKHSGLLHQNVVLPEPAPVGTYTVKVRQRFASDDESTWLVKTGHVTIKATDNDTKPGQTPFVVTRLVDPEQMGTKSILRHHVPFGDDHEQPNARYGVGVELVVTNPNGGDPDLPDDIVRGLRELTPITITRHGDEVVLTSGNPPILRKNHNFKIKYVVTVVPLKTDGDHLSSEGFDVTPGKKVAA